MEPEKYNDLDLRVRKLESSYSNEVVEIHAILKKIEARMLGSLDGQNAGLISEVHQLKKEAEIAKLEIQKIQASLTLELAQIKISIDQIAKYKWIVYGALLAIGYIMNYIVRIPSLFKSQ